MVTPTDKGARSRKLSTVDGTQIRQHNTRTPQSPFTEPSLLPSVQFRQTPKTDVPSDVDPVVVGTELESGCPHKESR